MKHSKYMCYAIVCTDLFVHLALSHFHYECLGVENTQNVKKYDIMSLENEIL